jgi:hypothetical protein
MGAEQGETLLTANDGKLASPFLGSNMQDESSSWIEDSSTRRGFLTACRPRTGFVSCLDLL